MNFGDILFDVPIVLRHLFRKLESTDKRLISNKWSTTFNRICLKENLMPKHTTIRHHDPVVRNTSSALDYRGYLIKRELKIKENDQVRLSKQRDFIVKQIKECQGEPTVKSDVMNALNNLFKKFRKSSEN